MNSTIRFLFGLFLLLSSSVAFTQTDTSTASSGNVVGDLNNDGERDSKDTAIAWWLTNRNRAEEFSPEITSFTASSSRVQFNRSVTLRWQIRGNPTSISIDSGVGDVTNLKSINVTPQTTTTYTLTAVNSKGSATAQVTVRVIPKLVSFTSSPRVITSGETSTLSWEIEGETTEVSIDQGVGDVTGSSSIMVSPTKTTTYTITVISSGGSVSSKAAVYVKPKIISFTANPTTVAPNTISKLSWRIDGEPTEISIDQGVGDVTGLTEVEVSPRTTTTYKITASNNHGSVKETVKVNVKDVPVITSFTASDTIVTSGESTVLRWRVTGSDSLSLETNTGSSTPTTETVTGSSKRVRPTVTTTYTLTATNSTGTTTATVKVYVLKITSFTANPSSIVSGDSSELSWEIEGEPTEISINRDVGNVTGLSSVSVSPEETTTYILTARKTEGDRSRTLTKRVTVTVENIPVIESFTASDTIVTSGESTVLRWRVTGSDSLSLETNTGSSTPTTETVTGSSKRVRPTVTTTYTLTATNSTGTTTATVKVYVLKITSFTANPSSIVSGDSSELSWEIEGEPTEISINRDVGNVTGLSSVSVSPTMTTIYTLTAKKTDGSVSKTVTKNVEVTVDAPPVIESFTASKNLLVAVSNESTLLRWNVTGDGPISVSLSKTVGSTTTTLLSSLPINSSHSQSPTVTTTYTLNATNSTGTTTATVKVHVLNIKTFTATPVSIIPGGNSKLSWDIDGEPTSVSIDNSVGTGLDASGNTIVTPTTTTTYTLTAQKMDNSIIKAVTAEVTVTVRSLPVITSFTANPPVVSCSASPCATSATLNWAVTGADTLSINQGVGPVTGLSSTNVTPQDTTVYTLTATNSSGSITKNVTVSVLKINSFTANPTFISGSEHSVLSWSLGGGPNSISISNNINSTVLDVTDSNSIVMTPEETTTYTLTVSRTEGTTMETVTETVTVYKLKIKSFTATPDEIVSGNSSLLAWEVDGEPTDVSINHNVGTDLGASSSISVSPSVTTTYTLTATKTEGSRTRIVNQSVRVTVTAPSSGFSGDDKIQDCKGCPKLSAVPTTLLGQGSSSNLKDIDIDNPFSAIGIQKVTWEEWQMCVSEEVCAYYEFPETLLEHPAVGIQLRDVSIYVDWLFSKTGKKYRLLESQEWQSMINHIADGNAPADINLDSFVTDESDLFLNSSVEISTYRDDLILDAGFRVVRDIDPVYGE